MEPSRQLARNLIAESKAYGYTLVIWGAGGMLIHRYGAPNIVQVGLYVGGALAAITVLTVAAFGGLLGEHGTSEERLVAASIVHFLATGGNLLVSYALIVGSKQFGLPSDGAFLLVGFQATLLYNIFLLLEYSIIRALE